VYKREKTMEIKTFNELHKLIEFIKHAIFRIEQFVKTYAQINNEKYKRLVGEYSLKCLELEEMRREVLQNKKYHNFQIIYVKALITRESLQEDPAYKAYLEQKDDSEIYQHIFKN
jgi:hypothetical protein